MPLQTTHQKKMIRVVVVDDSPTARELLVAILHELGNILVVGTGSNGEDAIRLVKRYHPDLVTMDAEMPKMDGLEATRRIMRECPTPIVIVTASRKHDEMDLTFKALQAGALQVVNKPGLNDPDTSDLVVKTVRMMSSVPVIHHWGRMTEVKSEPRPVKVERTVNGKIVEPNLANRTIIGIASSTGGPSALAALLRSLTESFPLPIMIVQHVSPGFSPGLADWLSEQTRLHVKLASHGCELCPGVALLAPDDYHMQVNERGIVELLKSEPYKGLRPSANYMFNSLARVYGARAAGFILTGMGDDGAAGMEALHRAGGITFAQDEESCVVFGMPHEAIVRNAVDYVMNIEQMVFTLARLNPMPQSPVSEDGSQ